MHIDDADKLMEHGQREAAFFSAHDLIYIKYGIKVQKNLEWSPLEIGVV